ncbi:protein S100-A8-like [Octodon degus]|uniref:Protein S100-A8-like n=1 Tax=Octodon degus TaxID=10160 RepID=A0A6P3F1P2_OCTDE|nr:protein S100-A8-like [Octodon degus]
MMTELETALEDIINVYHKYSIGVGHYDVLYRGDLKRLLTNECPQYTKKRSADDWFKLLDVNEDGAVTFQEFLVLVTKLLIEEHKREPKTLAGLLGP